MIVDIDKARARATRAWFLRRYLVELGFAAGNLRAQKTRTFLTALGIVFGVGSVIGMMAISAGRARNHCGSSSSWACGTC